MSLSLKVEAVDLHAEGLRRLGPYLPTNIEGDTCQTVMKVRDGQWPLIGKFGWFTSNGHDWFYRPDIAGDTPYEFLD